MRSFCAANSPGINSDCVPLSNSGGSARVAPARAAPARSGPSRSPSAGPGGKCTHSSYKSGPDHLGLWLSALIHHGTALIRPGAAARAGCGRVRAGGVAGGGGMGGGGRGGPAGRASARLPFCCTSLLPVAGVSMAIERGCQHNKSLAGGCLQAELRGQAAGGGVSYYAVLEVERCGERERERHRHSVHLQSLESRVQLPVICDCCGFREVESVHDACTTPLPFCQKDEASACGAAVHHSPCSKNRLSSSTMALITSYLMP